MRAKLFKDTAGCFVDTALREKEISLVRIGEEQPGADDNEGDKKVEFNGPMYSDAHDQSTILTESPLDSSRLFVAPNATVSWSVSPAVISARIRFVATPT